MKYDFKTKKRSEKKTHKKKKTHTHTHTHTQGKEMRREQHLITMIDFRLFRS